MIIQVVEWMRQDYYHLCGEKLRKTRNLWILIIIFLKYIYPETTFTFDFHHIIPLVTERLSSKVSL